MSKILSSIYSLIKNANAMNDKDSELTRIARIVTDCCVSEVRGENRNCHLIHTMKGRANGTR